MLMLGDTCNQIKIKRSKFQKNKIEKQKHEKLSVNVRNCDVFNSKFV